MRRLIYFGLVVTVLGAALSAGSHAAVDEQALGIWGDYVEARTASVFAGACHYNGELTTAGREAIMAWNVRGGSASGVELAGVRALAIVTSNANLAARESRRSELIVSDNATHVQAVALVNLLRAKHAAALGEVVAVKRAPLTFAHEGKNYSVSSGGTAALDIEAMPDDLCCKMPQLVWYEPLVSLAQRKVGLTKRAYYSGKTVGEPWERSGENSAFYGSFSY